MTDQPTNLIILGRIFPLWDNETGQYRDRSWEYISKQTLSQNKRLIIKSSFDLLLRILAFIPKQIPKRLFARPVRLMPDLFLVPEEFIPLFIDRMLAGKILERLDHQRCATVFADCHLLEILRI